METIQGWIGKYAQVREADTPGWGPEGLVTYPAGIGGFIRGADESGRPVVELSYYYGQFNASLAAYGRVAFRLETLYLSDSVRAWGRDER